MFKKLLKAALPALFVFSFANVNDAKVEAANKKINVRVDYLEEGSNKKLAESAKLSGDENVFATISLPQNLANEYNISKRDFSNESKGQIAANKIYDQELVYQVYFTKKPESQISRPYTQTYTYVTTQTQAHVVATTQVHKQLVASGSVSHSSTIPHSSNKPQTYSSNYAQTSSKTYCSSTQTSSSKTSCSKTNSSSSKTSSTQTCCSTKPQTCKKSSSTSKTSWKIVFKGQKL